MGGQAGVGGAGGAAGGGDATGGGGGLPGSSPLAIGAGGDGAFIVAAARGILFTGTASRGEGLAAIYGNLTLSGSAGFVDGIPRVHPFADWNQMSSTDFVLVGGAGGGGTGASGQILPLTGQTPEISSEMVNNQMRDLNSSVSPAPSSLHVQSPLGAISEVPGNQPLSTSTSALTDYHFAANFSGAAGRGAASTALFDAAFINFTTRT